MTMLDVSGIGRTLIVFQLAAVYGMGAERFLKSVCVRGEGGRKGEGGDLYSHCFFRFCFCDFLELEKQGVPEFTVLDHVVLLIFLVL